MVLSCAIQIGIDLLDNDTATVTNSPALRRSAASVSRRCMPNTRKSLHLYSSSVQDLYGGTMEDNIYAASKIRRIISVWLLT